MTDLQKEYAKYWGGMALGVAAAATGVWVYHSAMQANHKKLGYAVAAAAFIGGLYLMYQNQPAKTK